MVPLKSYSHLGVLPNKTSLPCYNTLPQRTSMKCHICYKLKQICLSCARLTTITSQAACSRNVIKPTKPSSVRDGKDIQSSNAKCTTFYNSTTQLTKMALSKFNKTHTYLSDTIAKNIKTPALTSIDLLSGLPRPTDIPHRLHNKPVLAIADMKCMKTFKPKYSRKNSKPNMPLLDTMYQTHQLRPFKSQRTVTRQFESKFLKPKTSVNNIRHKKHVSPLFNYKCSLVKSSNERNELAASLKEMLSTHTSTKLICFKSAPLKSETKPKECVYFHRQQPHPNGSDHLTSPTKDNYTVRRVYYSPHKEQVNELRYVHYKPDNVASNMKRVVHYRLSSPTADTIRVIRYTM